MPFVEPDQLWTALPVLGWRLWRISAQNPANMTFEEAVEDRGVGIAELVRILVMVSVCSRPPDDAFLSGEGAEECHQERCRSLNLRVELEAPVAEVPVVPEGHEE